MKDLENFKWQVEKSPKIILLDFTSYKCKPCKEFIPALLDIERKFENLEVLEVNLHKNLTLAKKYDIKIVPTLVMVVRGEEKMKLVGETDRDRVLYEIGRVIKYLPPKI